MFGQTEFGLYGLGVVGKSLSRNLASKGFIISMFNGHPAAVEEDVAVNFKTANSSANFIQAQRDYFGAHTHQGFDDTSEKPYYTNWK